MDTQEMKLTAVMFICSLNLAFLFNITMLLFWMARRQDYLWEQHNKNEPKKEEETCPKPT